MLGFLSWALSPQVPKGAELIPQKVILEKKSPDASVVAQILQGKIVDGFNVLGSDTRFYLCINYPDSKHLILRDLSEGFGSYEGGVIGLDWKDSKKLHIQRYVGDQRSDIIYDVTNKKWHPIENKEGKRELSH